MSNADPTFKGPGEMRIVLVNNGLESFPHWEKGSITNPTPPKHRWVEGTDYVLYKQLYPKKRQSFSCLTYGLAWIRQRGPDNVAEGDTYSCEFEPIKDLYRFKVDIVGVKDGSVLRPSIGLYNLINEPGEWTYFAPSRFTGEWGLQCITPWFYLVTGLSVTYNPGQSPAPGRIGYSNLICRLDNAFSYWPDSELPVPRDDLSAPQQVLIGGR